MRVYHSTTFDAAASIRRQGFRDAIGNYGLIDRELAGVFVAKTPADENEGAKAQDVVFAIDIPDSELEPYWIVEYPEDGRIVEGEACVPSELLNRYNPRVVVWSDEAATWLVTDDA